VGPPGRDLRPVLGKGQLVAVEGRIQTRQWEDDKKQRHWKTDRRELRRDAVGPAQEGLRQRIGRGRARHQADRLGVEPIDEASGYALAAAGEADGGGSAEDEAELEAVAA
jgi:single-stranded DNA-binding protein